jgi:hypothetical protein
MHLLFGSRIESKSPCKAALGQVGGGGWEREGSIAVEFVEEVTRSGVRDRVLR